MKKVLKKVVALFISVLIAGCMLVVPAFAAGDIPDCNNDGNANILDLVILKKALVAGSQESKYDFDRNGKVNAADCTVMICYILGIDEVYMNEDVADDIF